MGGHLDADEGLHREPERRGVEPGAIALDQPLGLKPLLPAPRLAGAESEALAEGFGGGVGVLLELGQEPEIGVVKLCHADIVHRNAYICN